MFGPRNVGMVCTNPLMHPKICLIPMIRYSMDKALFMYPSIVVAMKKLKLKEDEDGNKVSDVRGIPCRL